MKRLVLSGAAALAVAMTTALPADASPGMIGVGGGTYHSPVIRIVSPPPRRNPNTPQVTINSKIGVGSYRIQQRQ